MKFLILGGIAESKQLAAQLINNGHSVIYSIAGLVRQPDLQCTVHTGGFSQYGINGIQGLRNYLKSQNIDLLIDATHPYAVEMSSHAVDAVESSGIECWRFSRPGWDRSKYNGLNSYSEIADLLPRLHNFFRPFFSIGSSTLQFVGKRPTHQQWVIRSARPFVDIDGVVQINAIGPFTLKDELTLMRQYEIDALISKDSGCNRVSAKLDAACQLGIPVFLQDRPELAPTDRSFDSIDTLIAAIASH